MKNKVLFLLSYRSLWSHRLRAILTITGVTIGIASIIFLVSLGYGLEQLVTNQIANFSAFTIIETSSSNARIVKMDQEAIQKISEFPKIQSVGRVANLAGRIKKVESDSTAETVIIAGDANYWKLAEIKPDDGNLPKEKNEMMINKSVLNLINENSNDVIGKTLKLSAIIPAELRQGEEQATTTVEDIELKVSGLSNDEQSPIVYLDDNLLLDNGMDKYSSFKVQVAEKDSKSIAETRAFLDNFGYKTDYIGDTISEINQVFSLFRVILAAFGLIALVVAALGTFNTLTISLLERTREVGLMKALGMRNRDIYKLFLVESLIIGIFGGIIGLFVGVILGQVINLVVRLLAVKSQVETISLFSTPWLFAVGVASFSIIVGFLTGLYPAKRAVKINALDALKYE
ncbi:MAG: ABC transporter permease [Patescibacteria group bacterium]|nr:ABC transporter permease [Patescibacteria group bacterium]